MKLFLKYLIIASLAVFSLNSCAEKEEIPNKPDQEQNEGNQDPKPDEGGQDPKPDEGGQVNPSEAGFFLTLNLASPIKDIVASNNMQVTEDNKVTAWSISKEGVANYHEFSERDIPITEYIDNGLSAKVKFSNLPQGGKTWVAYHSNVLYDGCSAAKVEFKFRNQQNQLVAGKVNPAYLNMISSEIVVPEFSEGQNSATLDAQIKLVGTLFDYSIVSGSGKYADELIESITLTHTGAANIAGTGDGACMAYNFTKNGGYILDDNNVTDKCFLYWQNDSKSVKTILDQPIAVSNAASIYMSLAPIQLEGYSYTVVTDKAVYKFNHAAESVELIDNSLVKVNLDLDSAERMDASSVKGALQYFGSVPGDFVTDHVAKENVNIGWWAAQIMNDGEANWQTMEASDENNASFYKNVVFEVIDDATNAPADWVTVKYRDRDTWWVFDVLENTTDNDRTATIKATFGDVNGYVLGDPFKEKTMKFIQHGGNASAVKTIAFWGGVGPFEFDGQAGVYPWSYWVMRVDNIDANNFNDPETCKLYESAVITCYEWVNNQKGAEASWLKCQYRRNADGKVIDTWWDIEAEANNTGAPRQAYVECVYPELPGYQYQNNQNIKAEIVTQKAL